MTGGGTGAAAGTRRVEANPRRTTPLTTRLGHRRSVRSPLWNLVRVSVPWLCCLRPDPLHACQSLLLWLASSSSSASESSRAPQPPAHRGDPRGRPLTTPGLGAGAATPPPPGTTLHTTATAGRLPGQEGCLATPRAAFGGGQRSVAC